MHPCFDVPTALDYAQRGEIEAWIHAYLLAGDWANPALSNGLKLQRRWWIGPLELSLNALARSLGPEPGMEYQVTPENWDERTGRIAASLADPLTVPPLLVEYRSGELSVRDGNHRHGAMARKGWSTAWVIIWYNSEEAYRAHRQWLAAAVNLRGICSDD